jgi:pentatricopeptide repeat protein
MTCRVVVRCLIRDGRVADAVDLLHRINSQIIEMGGVQGEIFQESTGGAVGGGLAIYWDFASFSDWGRWEDSFPADQKFQSLFAEVIDPKSPIVTPFERTIFSSVP